MAIALPTIDKKTDADLNALATVSSKIRFLHALGWKRSQIALKLNKRYQHVRNVLLTPLKVK
jgi:hypothetical protein